MNGRIRFLFQWICRFISILFFVWVWADASARVPWIDLSKQIFDPWVIQVSLQTVFQVLQSLTMIVLLSGIALFWVTRPRLPTKKTNPLATSVLPVALNIFAQWFWVMPSVVLVGVTFYLLKSLGLQNLLYSFWAVKLAWILGLSPYVILGLLSSTHALDSNERMAARTLGASAWTIFWTITIPPLGPLAIRLVRQSAWVMLTSFSVVVILSGGTPNDTLETAMYQIVRTQQNDIARAFAFGFWQFFILIVIPWILSRMVKKNFLISNANTQKVGAQKTELQSNHGCNTAVQATWFFVLFIWMAVFIHADSLQVDLRSPLQDGLTLAVSVSLLILFLCGFIYFSGKSFWWIATSSAWVSPMLLSTLWWNRIVMQDSSSVPAIVLCGLAQVTLLLPWAWHRVVPLFVHMQIHQIQAARTLGASWVQAYIHVEWPRVRLEFKNIFAFIAALSLAESGFLVLFAKDGFEPIALWVQNQYLRFQFEAAASGVSLLMLTSLLMILFLNWERKSRHV